MPLPPAGKCVAAATKGRKASVRVVDGGWSGRGCGAEMSGGDSGQRLLLYSALAPGFPPECGGVCGGEVACGHCILRLGIPEAHAAPAPTPMAITGEIICDATE